ncbi:hypothetical protein ACJ5NV_08575 [Loktanella agnita]|uniref:hypothetical protein n=1 Tax=Loktanella agnita TaxID=287097 RepID=UPI0039869588
MGTFIKTLFGAPFVGLVALIGALPYLLPAAGLVVLHPWFTLSLDQTAAITTFVNEIPVRFGWAPLSLEIDAVLAVEIVVIGFFVLLFLFRIQSTALHMLGIAPLRPLRALFLPAWRWLLLPGLLFAALGIAALVIGAERFAAHELRLERLGWPVNTMSVADHYAQHSSYLRALFAVMLGVFAVFGLAMVQNSTAIRVRMFLVLRDMPSILMLGAAYAVLSTVAIVYLFQGARLVLPVTYINQYATLGSALLLNAVLYFTLMSAACAFLLKRQLMKVVAYSD